MLRTAGTPRRCKWWDGVNNQGTCMPGGSARPHSILQRGRGALREKPKVTQPIRGGAGARIYTPKAHPVLGQVALLAAPCFSGSSSTTNLLGNLGQATYPLPGASALSFGKEVVMPALYDCCVNNITEPYTRSAVTAKTPFRLSGGPARSPQ